jgi:uncharacterized membrane protein (UPF0127 family)
MKKIIAAVLIVLIVGIGKAYGYESGKIVIYGKKTFKAGVLIANKPNEWVLGLMYIRHLDKNAGLLMILPSAKVAIWMKNMLMPIDCIYINKKEVVRVYKNLPVCITKNCKKYYSKSIVNMILEVNAGTAKRYGIKKNDEVRLKITP